MRVTKYSKERLLEAASASRTIAGVLRYLGVNKSGGMCTYIRARLTHYGIDTSHFVGSRWAKGLKRPELSAHSLKGPEHFLRRTANRIAGKLLRRSLIKMGVQHVCSVCGQEPIWQGKPLVLEVDHKDGDPTNNLLDNLRFLCPHCHSQTPNFRNRRVGSGNPERLISIPTQFDSERADKKGRKRKSAFKITWPPASELSELVVKYPIETIGKSLGVSGVAVKKHCVKLGIPTPKRGQWGRNGESKPFSMPR